MKEKKRNKPVLPKFRIDKSMEKYNGKIIFKEKWEAADKFIKEVGLPNE